MKHRRLRGWLYAACVAGALCVLAAAPCGDGVMAAAGTMAGDAHVRALSTLVEWDETPCMK